MCICPSLKESTYLSVNLNLKICNIIIPNMYLMYFDSNSENSQTSHLHILRRAYKTHLWIKVSFSVVSRKPFIKSQLQLIFICMDFTFVRKREEGSHYFWKPCTKKVNYIILSIQILIIHRVATHYPSSQVKLCYVLASHNGPL